MSSEDEIQQMLDDLTEERYSSKLTDWEYGFIDSVMKQIATRPLSAKQVERLEAIWERVT